jgi:hypothetical protein
MIDLSLIFRSIINFKDSSGSETLSQKNLIKNFQALQKNVPDEPEDRAYKELYFFILDHVRSCDTSQEYELPSYDIIKKFFEESGGEHPEEVLKALEQIKTQVPFIGQDYYRILRTYKEELDQEKLNQILIKTNKIAQVGDKEGTGKNIITLKGIPDALNYFARKSRSLRNSSTGIKLESQIISRDDVDEEKKDYLAVKKDPLDTYGITTGLSPIDKVWNLGLQNTELMLVTAFTSHGKTAFSMYMAYRAILMGFNTAVISLEQTFKEIRTQIYVKHTCNPIMAKRFPEFAHLIGTLDIKNVKSGKLTEEQQAFYFAACEDLATTEGYGKLNLWYPPKAKPTVSEIEFNLSQVQQEYKTVGRNLEFVVLDYISLLGLSREEMTKDANENQNVIIRNLKSLCNTFNGGQGLRMLSPFQANRDGLREAKQNDGVYQLTALSGAHEAERSADGVIAMYMEDIWRNEGKIKFSCLKGRRNGFFNAFNARVNYKSLFYTDSNIDENMDEIEAVERIQTSLQHT